MKKLKKIDVLDTSWEPELRDKINSLIEAVEAQQKEIEELKVDYDGVHPNACECKLCCPLPLGFEIHPDGAVTTATKPPKRSHSTKDGNKQLREALTEEIMLNSELNQKEATLLLDAILSTISEALPKEQKEHKTLIVEYGYGRKTQIHPLSDWDLGYNQAISDIHQLLK